MIEYPSIIGCSKAPRENCIAFDKLDGSNLRFKWTSKRGFDTFGTRTQTINIDTPLYGNGVKFFLKNQAPILDSHFRKNYPNTREIIVFGEFYGPNSFAGNHQENEDQKVTVFDILLGHKNREFVKPKQLIKEFGSIIELPKVIYEGNLNEEFINDVRENKYSLNEGVIVKGTTNNGAFRGKMWQCKIKTKNYLERIYKLFGQEGLKKYGE
jgi:hypothetical protein